MAEHDVYQRLADHLSNVGMGYPVRQTLLEILRENLNPSEAEIVLALPNKVIPFFPVSVDEILSRVTMPVGELERTLERLVQKGALYAGRTPAGEKGYAPVILAFLRGSEI